MESVFFTSHHMIFVEKFTNSFGENKTIGAGGKYFLHTLYDTGKRKVDF